jgi:hypothetical protein
MQLTTCVFMEIPALAPSFRRLSFVFNDIPGLIVEKQFFLDRSLRLRIDILS